ncbi:MAG: hypothetical protein J7M19_05470, partial [Planctomycetes bacterium]|nr:hypothetical protein [Planctomycetota bacterium]
MNQAIRLVLQTRAFKALLQALPGGRVRAGGLTHGAASLAAAALALGTRREVLLVAAHIDLAEDLYENVRLFVPGAALLEPRDRATSFEAIPALDAASARVRLLKRYLPGGDRPRVVVTCAPALVESVPSARDLAAGTLQVERGTKLEMTSLARWLVEHDFTREYEADRPWKFALRGGIADVFCPGEDAPVRIEFFGDEVASIRSVDPATLLGAGKLDSVRLVAPASPSSRRIPSPFTRLLLPDAIVLLQEPSDIQQAAESHAARFSSADTVAWKDIWKSFEEFTLVESTEFEFADEDSISFESRTFSIAAGEVEGILEEFADFARRMRRTLVFALNDAEKSRLGDLFREAGAGGGKGRKRLFSAVVGRFNHSFYFAESGLAFIAHQDIFHRYRTRRDVRVSAPSRPILAIAELVPGDYLVHIDHGIARYAGTKVIEKDSVRREYLVLEFGGGTRLLVPVSH